MSYPEAIIKLSWGGVVAGQDVWTNGISLAEYSVGGDGAITAFADLEPVDFKTAIDAAFGGANGICDFLTLTWIKLALIGTDGLYLEEAKIYDYPTPLQGTSNFIMSPQDTVVVSLLTDTPRGLANRGRIYLPSGFAQPGAGTGVIGSTGVNTVLTKFHTFFDAVNTVGQTSTPPVFVSVASATRTGAIHIVQSIEVGNIVDTQRRRRNRLSESYTSQDLG